MIRFDKALCDLATFAAADRTRYSLNGVYVQPAAGKAEASDGKILARLATLNGDGQDMPKTTDPANPVIIARKAVENLGKMLKGKADNQRTASLDMVAPDKLAAVNANATLPMELVAGLYPNTAHVWPDGRDEHRITLAAGLLKRLAAFVEKHGVGDDFGNVPIDFYFGKRGDGGLDPDVCVRFVAKIDDSRELTGLVMPMENADERESRKAKRRKAR